MIDHTLLKTDARRAQMEQLCAEARQYSFATVCVQPVWVELAVELLTGSPVLTCTVSGFPQGANLPSVKLFETLAALRQGAQEVDMVINVGALKDGKTQLVQDEIQALADACHSARSKLKVIIECCLLSDDEKRLACKLSVQAGADFVKTSTGMSTSGAKVEDVRLMRSAVGPNVGVKAAGGIRTAKDALAMIEAGANRIGASASVGIVKELGAV
jgi:deoxyribose-phosphate aldolase